MQFSADKIQIKYYVLQKDNVEVSYVGHHLVAQNQDCPVLPHTKYQLAATNRSDPNHEQSWAGDVQWWFNAPHC